MITQFDATYWDIVPGERIVYAYRMTLDGVPLMTPTSFARWHVCMASATRVP